MNRFPPQICRRLLSSVYVDIVPNLYGFNPILQPKYIHCEMDGWQSNVRVILPVIYL